MHFFFSLFFNFLGNEVNKIHIGLDMPSGGGCILESSSSGDAKFCFEALPGSWGEPVADWRDVSSLLGFTGEVFLQLPR